MAKHLGPWAADTTCSRPHGLRAGRRLPFVMLCVRSQQQRAYLPADGGSSSGTTTTRNGLEQQREPRAPEIAAQGRQGSCDLSRRALLSMCLAAAVALRPAAAGAADEDEAAPQATGVAIRRGGGGRHANQKLGSPVR